VPPERRTREGSDRQKRLKTSSSSPDAVTDAVVAHRAGDGVIVAQHPDPHGLPSAWSMALAMRLRRNPVHGEARIDTRRFTSVDGQLDDQVYCGVVGEMPDVVECTFPPRTRQILRLDRPNRDTGVVREISSRSLSSVSNRSSSLTINSVDLPQRGLEVLAVVIDEVGGHPDRGHGVRKLVADVRN